MDEEQLLLHLTLHHIVSDGWSIGVLLRDLSSAYDAIVGGTPLRLPELPLQYADFAFWQRRWFDEESGRERVEAALEHLRGAPDRLVLRGELRRSGAGDRRGRQQSFAFDRRLSAALAAVARRERVTLFMLLLAAFQSVLAEESGSDDVVVATDVSNRLQLETESLVGQFINQIVVRTDLSGRPGLPELLRRVRRAALHAYACQDVPFELLAARVDPRHELGHTPIAQCKLILQNVPDFGGVLARVSRAAAARLAGASIEAAAPFDLTIFASETEDGLSGSMVYSTERFDDSYAAALLGAFESTLRGFAAASDDVGGSHD